MKRGVFLAFLAAGTLVAVVSIYGFVRLHQRPGLPLEWGKSAIRQLDNLHLTSQKDREFFLSQRSIGARVHVVYEEGRSPSICRHFSLEAALSACSCMRRSILP